MKVSDRLTDIAEIIVQQSLDLAWQQITARHGVPMAGASPDTLVPAGMIIVAYGKFGGIELGYGSDLDLVFLHDSHGEVQRTSGPQPVENSVFFLRLVQRVVHLLTVHTAAGRLYEVDTRLRPSGKGGLLAQSIDGFADYQRSEAWTWEHQALLRSRAVAGTRWQPAWTLRGRCASTLLRSAIRRDTLREDVRAMRERMRAELSRSKPGEFDLKQDAGGITDIEFLAQYWALRWADRYPGTGHVFGQHPPARKPRLHRPGAAGYRGRADDGLSCVSAAPAPSVARWREQHRPGGRVRGHACGGHGHLAGRDGQLTYNLSPDDAAPTRCRPATRSHGRITGADFPRRAHRQDHDPGDQVGAHDRRGQAAATCARN